MNKKNLFAVGILLSILVLVFIINQVTFDATGLDDAMSTYLNAVGSGDPPSFLELLPTNKKFRFSSYSGKTGNILGSETYSRDQVSDDFASKGGLYFAIFIGDSNYRYQDRILSAPIDRWERHRNVYRWQEGNLKSYVKWRKEADGWKVEEVGDMMP